MKKILILPALIMMIILLGQCTPKSSETVTIDLSQKKEIISPFIYGQFTEHLGRCIYGGIWAEMLEDRKFYYPVTDKYEPWGVRTDSYWNAGEFKILVASPWKTIGPGGKVKMSERNPFTGKHNPEITLSEDKPTGISQEGIYLRQGLQYNGRIILSATSGKTKIRIAILKNDELQFDVTTISDIPSEYKTYEFQFTPEKEIENAVLSITGIGSGNYRIGTVSLMPGDNINGFNKDVIAALKELNSPVYRWPGGNFVSGYNWRDGIGDRDKRPPRKNPAWTGVEHNDVGIHEFMELCSLINTQPYVSVNTGLGTVDEVAQEVEYINGDQSTAMGKIRAANGHPESYKVKFWAVGNEMYGDWQLGHIPLSEYVKKHISVVEAMKKIDNSIATVAVGAVGEWSKTMLTDGKDHMELLSEHIYCKDKPVVREHVAQLRENIKRVADEHRKYRKEIPGLAEKDIRIAMDEWNYWYGDYLYGELGCRYFWRDGMGTAEGLHEYFRNSDIYYMANYAQTVNVIGAIKTTKKDVQFETTGIIMKFYREHFGQKPLDINDYKGPLDVSAAIDTVSNLLTIAVVNCDSISHDFNLKCLNGKAKEAVSCQEVSNPDPMAYNEPGKERQVDIRKAEWETKNFIAVKPMTVGIYKIKI